MIRVVVNGVLSNLAAASNHGRIAGVRIRVDRG